LDPRCVIRNIEMLSFETIYFASRMNKFVVLWFCFYIATLPQREKRELV